MADFYMVFDVESVGLHGEAFAVGYVVVTPNGEEVAHGRHSCPIDNAVGDDSDREWVNRNTPRWVVDCSTPAEVRQAFWTVWRSWDAKGAVLVADCAWPVEARFLSACVDIDPAARRWQGPYPLHDVASARLAVGLAPLGTEARLPGEQPKHDPLADARQSARLWIEALAALRSPLTDILTERACQDAKWGEQNHPDGTGRPGDLWRATFAKEACEKAVRHGDLTFRHILDEEVQEAFAESDPVRLREELIQVAAVAVAWVEKLDREVQGG